LDLIDIRSSSIDKSQYNEENRESLFSNPFVQGAPQTDTENPESASKRDSNFKQESMNSN